jgi:phosphoglycerol transferase MdoB-like AlkP superfamily enzyme
MKKDFIDTAIRISLALFLTIFLQFFVRLIELIFLQITFPIELNPFLNYSLNFDSIIIILLFTSISPLIVILNFISKNVAVKTLWLFSSSIVITSSIFSLFYVITHEPLTSIAFNFSLKESVHIVTPELIPNLFQFITLLIFNFLGSYISFRVLNRIKLNNFKFLPIITLILFIVALINIEHTTKEIHHFTSRKQYIYYNSKLAFFLKSLKTNKYQSEHTKKEEQELIITYQNSNLKKHYLDSQYPLLNSTIYPNVLGNSFHKSDLKPNIVFIISESLSMTFLGVNSKYNIASHTDSLSNKGIHWENFYSNAEKSYGVLPNLLASLPNGPNKRGFVNYIENNSKYPSYTSIIEILQSNGYQTSFFYGGWGGFDHVSSFIKNSKIDEYYDVDNFDSTLTKFLQPHSEEQFIWGYDDSVLFQQAYTQIKTAKQPFLSIIQTISLHSPYNLAPKKYFDINYQRSRLKSINIEYDSIVGISKNELACILFSDDALNDFFEKLKTIKSFENTIFIVTGDHGLNGGLVETHTQNYHVPLIIYSPLIKQRNTYYGQSSHVDVVPSLLALLNGNFGIKVSDLNHWIGNGLDTSSYNNLNHPIYFNLMRNDLPQAIYKEGLYMGGKVFSMDNNDTHQPPKKATSKVELQLKANFFIHSYTVSSDKIWPNNFNK